MPEETHWSDEVFREIKKREIASVCTIPDGGLTRLLNLVKGSPTYRGGTLELTLGTRGRSHRIRLTRSTLPGGADPSSSPAGRATSVARSTSAAARGNEQFSIPHGPQAAGSLIDIARACLGIITRSAVRPAAFSMYTSMAKRHCVNST